MIMNYDNSFVKNPYARKDGRLITIHDLTEYERGAACGAECPQCKAPFIARMGEKKVWHFAHSGEGCDEERVIINSTYEMAKEAIEYYGFIITPSLYIWYINYGYSQSSMQLRRSNKPLNGYELIQESSKYTVNKVNIVTNGNGLHEALLIDTKVGEIAVKIDIDTEYCVERYNSQYGDYPTIEIYVGNKVFTEKSSVLYESFAINAENKRWLYIPKQDEFIRLKLEKSQAEYAEQQRIKAEQRKKSEEAAIAAEVERKERVEAAKRAEAERLLKEKEMKDAAREVAVQDYLSAHVRIKEFYEVLKVAKRIYVYMFSHQSNNTEKQRKVDDRIVKIKVVPAKFYIIVTTETKGDLYFCVKEIVDDKPVSLKSGGLYRMLDFSKGGVNEVLDLNGIVIE